MYKEYKTWSLTQNLGEEILRDTASKAEHNDLESE